MTTAPPLSPTSKLSTLVARPWVAVLVGTFLPLVGLLPWWISGARSVPSLSGPSPVLLIPLADDVALLLTSLLVTGSTLTGLVLRRLAGTHRSTTAFWAASGHGTDVPHGAVRPGAGHSGRRRSTAELPPFPFLFFFFFLFSCLLISLGGTNMRASVPQDGVPF